MNIKNLFLAKYGVVQGCAIISNITCLFVCLFVLLYFLAAVPGVLQQIFLGALFVIHQQRVGIAVWRV